MEDAGQELAGNTEHGGDHQHQTLSGGVSGGQGTGLQRAVAGTGGTGLRLHFDDLHGLAEQVLLTLRSPLVNGLGHLRGGGDRVNCCDFGKCIGCICRSGVTIHYYFVSHF